MKFLTCWVLKSKVFWSKINCSQMKLLGYFWKKLSSHVHCPWYSPFIYYRTLSQKLDWIWHKEKKRTLVLVANLCEYYTTTRVEYHPDSPCSNFAINTEWMNFSGKGKKIMKGNYFIFLSSNKWRKFFHDSAKGQLISECLFGVFNFFQKMNKNKSTWGIIVVRISKSHLKLTDL